MTWQPSVDIDEAIRKWMQAKGWEVTRTRYDTDKEVYAWRHGIPSATSFTLRVSRSVLEQYPAFALLEILDRLKVASAMRAHPDARLVVVQRGTRFIVEE